MLFADALQEDLPNEPVLKVWALDKPVKKTGLPTCQSTLSINNGRKPFPVCLRRAPSFSIDLY
jgi:hypothetical protein